MRWMRGWVWVLWGEASRVWAQGGMPPGSGGAEIRDVLPPVEIPYWTPTTVVVWSVVGFLALAALIVGGWVVWRRTRPVVVPPSPLQVALEALRRLKESPSAELSARDFAAEVAFILRRFLEANLGLRVTRQTTDEFLFALEANPRFGGVDRDRLRVFLEQCDRCKFAGVNAAAEARLALIAAAEAQVIGGRAES